MTRLRLVLLIWVGVLVPGAASAQDGGWIDWLEKLSGPKLWGIGTDVSPLCLNDQGQPVHCEKWAGLSREPIDLSRVKHEFSFRVAFYSKYGTRFSDVTDDRSIHAWKLMGMYHYYVTPSVHLGGGLGYMIFYGDGFDLFSRGILTPLSLLVYPVQSGSARGLFIRAEESYITQGLSGAIFGNPASAFSTTFEWNFSVGAGYDFRRHP